MLEAGAEFYCGKNCFVAAAGDYVFRPQGVPHTMRFLTSSARAVAEFSSVGEHPVTTDQYFPAISEPAATLDLPAPGVAGTYALAADLAQASWLASQHGARFLTSQQAREFASGTPSALPSIELRDRGYAGQIDGNQGMASANLLRIGGKAMEGWTFPVHPVLLASQLPDSNPVKPIVLKFIETYKNRFGSRSLSLPRACMWDSFLLTANAAEAALKGGQPGTPKFRRAVREALEKTHELVTTEGIYTMTPADHSGTDQRVLVLVTLKNGA